MSTLSTSLAPSGTSALRAVRLTDLEMSYGRRGLVVEIEAGPIGLVIYGESRATVFVVAHESARAARRCGDARAEVEHVGIDADEPAATRWLACVTLDWAKQARPGEAA